MSLGSNKNAILFNNCHSLKDLIVTLVLNRSLITKGNTGFSLQLNCYPQTNPQAKYKGYPLAWFQYVIDVYNSQVLAGIQYWSLQDPKDMGDVIALAQIMSNSRLPHRIRCSEAR